MIHHALRKFELSIVMICGIKNIMTLWKPDAALLTRPAYLSLADQIMRAISDGRLGSGARMPPHRSLAYELSLSVQTVSRAYETLIRRGMLAGEIGRGTYVLQQKREMDQPYLPERLGEVIDLSILKPVCAPIHVEHMKQALIELAETIPASAVLSFRPNVVFPRHRKVAADWLRSCGVEALPENISVTNGATPAMTIALMTAVPSGGTVAVEAISHHTLIPLVTYLGLKLRGLAMDDQGMLPEALEAACRDGGIHAVFLQPSAINPRAAVSSEKRRRDLAAVARRHDLFMIENDILGPLIEDKPPTLASIASERTLYITTLTKTLMPGLRIGYLSVPDQLAPSAANRHLVTNWMATPLMAEIASRWIANGTAMELVNWQRKALAQRHAAASEILQGIDYHSHPQSLHIWLPLPPDRDEAVFVSQARLRGVGIAPGASFRTVPDGKKPAVRISLGSSGETEMDAGLRIIASLYRAGAEALLIAV